MSHAPAPHEHQDETEKVESVQSYDQLVSGKLQELMRSAEQSCAQVAQTINWNEKDTLTLFIRHFHTKVQQDLGFCLHKTMLIVYSIFSLNIIISSLPKMPLLSFPRWQPNCKKLGKMRHFGSRNCTKSNALTREQDDISKSAASRSSSTKSSTQRIKGRLPSCERIAKSSVRSYSTASRHPK